jgi:signal transduction histidine kinase
MVIGYFLVHPLAMWAYILAPQHGPLPRDLAFWGREWLLAFSPGMIHMGAAFAILGAVAGFSLGAWYLQKARWMAEKLESQRRLVALETLRELMVTLAHHIRNANMVIGGFSARLHKHLSDPEIKRQIEMIQQASRDIEAVINSLENLTEINHTQYVSAWQTKMIDLNQELKARLDGGLARRERNEP